MASQPYAEATQAAIDGEVARLLQRAEERAVQLLNTHRGELDALVDLLLTVETVTVPTCTGWPVGRTGPAANATDR